MDFYEAYQSLFDTLVPPNNYFTGTLAPAAPDAGKIAALRALVERLGRVAAALNAAVEAVQDTGDVNPALSRAFLIATHCHGGASQMLVKAIDGSLEIQAATDAMNARSADLDAIAKSTQQLIDSIANVTSVLTLTGRVLKLIRA